MQTQENLMEAIASPDNLLNAWRIVRGNIPRYRRQRSAGPDGITIAEFERDLPVQLNTLRHMLLKGRYKPQPPGLFSIEKRNGGTRQIALLNVADRVAQRAAQQMIEPLYEPDFLPCSFGFRPGRSIQDAVYCARQLRGHGYPWVVDGDIASCFDSLHHKLLLKRISQCIRDRRVLQLLEAWLQVGILEHGLPAEPASWLVQGVQKASVNLRHGMDWAIHTFSRPEPSYDPYASVRYDRTAYPPEGNEASHVLEEDDLEEDIERFYYPSYNSEEADRQALQQRAVQQVTTGGMLIGTNLARRALAKAGPAAIASLKSPLGQQAIKRGLLAGGGAVGVAAGVAMTAYLLYRQAAPAPVGLLQGSPLSPLLANIYLHTFDVDLTKAGYRLVRFADDWVVLCPDQENAEIAFNQATLALDRIHLKINREKTHILSPAERLEWLGEMVG